MSSCFGKDYGNHMDCKICKVTNSCMKEAKIEFPVIIQPVKHTRKSRKLPPMKFPKPCIFCCEDCRPRDENGKLIPW